MPVREPGSWLSRARRGLLCACVCLLLAVAGHGAAGGHLPGVGALLVVLTVLTVMGTAAFGVRRPRFDVSVLMVGGVQFALHLVLHILSSARPGGHVAHGGHGPGKAGPSGPHHTLAHLAPAHRPSGQLDWLAAPDLGRPGLANATGRGVETAGAAAHSMPVAMTAGHALATLGTAVCLVYGERVLRRLVSLLFSGLRRVDPEVAVVPTPPRSPLAARDLPLPFGVLLVRSLPLRGPPVPMTV
ncbi:hypothetical protein LRS74_01020 [Streptomyces sp. LX-29]|uniref:hypothetical protein n=1 Tax=Streptomyces sp. LX-29 TaxID=2900152 RepID=UPI00240DD07F|nr:hypothetical protein [Streptomyces sp. LX-29]WFB05754.1 hypothetical protein LRS74_01020 [Streptomyces sp. LX-29]